MKKILILYHVVLLFCVVNATAQEVLTLPEAIRDAWANRKNIQAGALDSTISNLQTKALLKKYWPQVSLEYSYQYNPILQSSILPVGKFNPALPSNATESIQFGTSWSEAAGLNVTQPLIDAGVKQQIRESRLNERIADASQSQAKYALAYEVAKAYINVWLQEQQVKLTTIDSANTWESYRLQQDRFEQGRLLKYDLNKALINHHNAVQKVKDAIVQLIEDKIYLQFLTGRNVNPREDIEPDSNFFKAGFDHWMHLPVKTDSIPEMQQLALQQQLALVQQQSERSKYLPTLSIKGFLGANQYSNAFNPFAANSWFGYSYIGMDAKLPLLFGEDKQKKIRELQLQSDQYKMQREDKSAEYQQQAATAQLQLSNLQSQLQNQEANLILERESVKLIKDRVAAGQETASTLNSAELDLQHMEADYDNTHRQGWLFWLDYMKASGWLDKLWQ